MPADDKPPITVRGTEILSSDPPRLRLQKLARITLDSMVQFVGLLDAEGTVLEINKVALDAVGIKLADVEGRPFWTTFWWQVSDEINQTLRESIARAAKGEFVRWDTAIFGRAGGKETIIIDASLCPVLDDEGKVVFICAEGRDITEKKAQEREIAQKNIELQGLLERIRELDEIKTQFFANVSHELRTPLALILGPAQRLIADDGSLDLAQRQDSAQLIARNARMLLKHVNDLLDMSKIEAGKLKIELQETDVAALVRFLASHFVVLAAERNIQYSVEADQESIAAIDPDKLQRVLMNLLANAFKFVPDGGQVRCRLTHSEHDFSIAIEDSGPGVRPELRTAIFERFRQGDGSSTRRVGGTGLGLAIAKEFIELHRGRIEVLDSELGGARFEIVVPLHQLTTVQTTSARTLSLDRNTLDGLLDGLRPLQNTAEAPSHVEGVDRATVLIVEDNADMNRFISESLSEHFHVVSAFDGREGLAKAQRLGPTLVLSDIMMPHMSGDEMIAEMRKIPELQATPVLLLSAKADEALMVKLLEESAQDFIVKPFSEKDLLVRVRNLIAAEQARRQTEAALALEQAARQEAELQKRLLYSLFMQAPTLIAVLRGPEHRIELANPLVCQTWGRPEAELLDRPLLDALPELADQVFPELLNEIYRTGVPYVGRETPATFNRPDGASEVLYFNFVYSPFRNIDGEIEGIFVIASEVTEQIQAREQVNGLRVAAEGANRAKDEFLAMLGHELRNPLSPIVTALHLMKLQGPENFERARTVIERQVNHLIRLVDDLLDVSRIARGKVELKKEQLEVAEIVAKGAEIASPLLEQRRHTLTVAVPRDGLRVFGDATRLSQVFSNLLTNAAKYTPPGGEIVVRGERVDGEVVLLVRDSGIGIAPEALPHVFDLFVQERQAIDRSQGGLGLGLTIVRNLVDLHGGSVTAASAGVGRGSEFIVRLPVANLDYPAPQTTRLAKPNDQEVVHNDLHRILVVDDNDDAAVMLSHALSLQGYDTRIAADAPTALKVAAAFLPHVAFIDLGLPVMDGYELASHLRELPGLANIRLIAVTGYGQESDRQHTHAAGFHQHLVKPVNIDSLEDAMRN